MTTNWTWFGPLLSVADGVKSQVRTQFVPCGAGHWALVSAGSREKRAEGS